ncbi:MAG: hypothetical protein H7263_08940, partial [Candidatus Sericytochromatia bacterium]|nr:hypothetical protein [Candidatus Sericytochromatia bacterium]
MKKIFLALFVLSGLNLFSANAYSATEIIENRTPSNNFNGAFDKLEFHGDIGFGYDYSFGFAKLDKNLVLKDTTNYLTLDDRFRNYIYIQNADLSLKVNVMRLLHLNVSGALVSNGMTAEPLFNPDSYTDFNKFLQDRKRNIKNIWQRYGIIQDLNFTLKDENVDGSVVIGQQEVPFGYLNAVSIYPSSVTNPTITPMTEYINFNLRKENATPYQNSTLSNIRDIGISLNGNYSFFRFVTGLYDGAGTNTFDNNNEKDLFARLDFIAKGLGEIGVSHWRGKHVGYKSIYAINPERVDFEMYKTGFHGKIGNESLYLSGELIFNNDSWVDKTDVGQLGWYLEGTFKAPAVISATLRYESFNDNNVLKDIPVSANYGMRRLVANLTQILGENMKFKEEYSQTWEDLNEKIGTKTFG